MRSLLVAVIGVATIGCGGRIALEAQSSDGGSSTDATDAADADGQRGPAPVPTCTAENSDCVLNSNGRYTGAAIIRCEPVNFVGPWKLLLERAINGTFKVIQVQDIQKPGFGALFDDLNAPPARLTYRVCVADALGKRCGSPITTLGPPNCACMPIGCELAYNTSIDDGCGGTPHCGACPNGASCNTHHSCCPIGQEADGTGGCICATRPCTSPKYWDPSLCACVLSN